MMHPPKDALSTPRRRGHGTTLDRRSRLLIALIQPIYRCWMATHRVRWICPPESVEHIEAGKPVIFAIWHESLATTLYTHRGRGLIAMVSRHRDGELVTRLMHTFGFGTARGSTTRGGASALRTMIRCAKEGHPLAITPDGPKGPRRVAQKGVIEIARRSGAPIILVVPYAARAHRFRSWDRMALPWPFARQIELYGAPLTFAEDSDPAAGLTQLQERLDALTERAEANFVDLWRSGGRRSPHPPRPRPAGIEDPPAPGPTVTI